MKRTIRLICICLSMLIMISGALSGCASSTTTPSTSSTTVTETDSQPSNQPPSDRRLSYGLHSYDELKSFFFEPREDGSLRATDEVYFKIELYAKSGKDYTPYYESYLEWVQPIIEGKQPIYAPYMENELVYDDSIFISVTTRDWILFRPMIQYGVHINGIELDLDISYLTEDDIQYASDHTFLELVKYIRPSIDTPDKYDEEYYKSVVQDTIILDDQEIPAIHYKFGSRHRIITRYNNLMIVIEPSAGFDESWLKDLSFRPL